MGYKSLPITKRSAFKQVPKGAKITGSSTDSYIEADPTGNLSDVTVTSTDYMTPGSAGLINPGSPEFQAAFAKARKEGLNQFEFGGGVYTTELAKPKSPDVPGTDEDITKKPIMTTDPAVPEKKGDAFYAPEKRKQYRTAKIDRNQAEKAAKKAKRRGEIDEAEFKKRMSNISTQFDTDISNIKAQSSKQFEQGINPRSGRAVTMQEGKDAVTRQKNIKDLTAAEKAKLKSTTSTNTVSTGNPTDLASTIMSAVGPIINKINKKSTDDFNNAINSAFPIKSSFKMAGYGKKNKK